MEIFFLIFIAAWLVVSSLARVSENHKLRENQEKAIKQREEGLKEISKMLAKIGVEASATHNLMAALMDEELTVPPDATRVYAAVLRNGPAIRLHILPAKSIDEFISASKAIVGKEWNADVIEYLDVHPTEKVIVREPVKADKREMGLQQGLHFLELTRDKFARGPQKKTMEAIISTYKQTYDIS